MNHQSVQEEVLTKGVDQPFSAKSLRKLCLEEGADDVGFVDIDREAISFEKNDLLTAYSKTQTIISIIKTMNRENVRSPIRYIANNEFHHVSHEIEEVSRRIILRLNQLGIRGVRTSMGFPMDADRWPGKIWYVSHKVMAVQAGIGQMGIHRNVIHPKYGNFIILDSILIDTQLDQYGQPLTENPCFDCRLCISACPVGAVREDGLDFTACATHNYREFMGRFQEWVEQVVSSKSVKSYRSKIHDRETFSFWQSLSFGANYKAAYCMAVCPAGEDIIHQYHTDKKARSYV
ncbi:MAG: 4Fe-4S ferredoxin [bacterium]|nr:MAG: 4Fe-4S ferredoxin [bacterium]